MFHNKSEIIARIKQASGNDIFELVECRINPEDDYNIYIFTMVLKDQEDLIRSWQDISSDIAIYFQGELETEIEIWNIYILFFVQGSVDNEVRYLVEQNKYSSRKLVIEDIESPITEKYINDIINEKLFNVKIDSVSNMSNPTETVSSTLETKYKNLFNVIKNSQEKPPVLFTKYLELLKNEL